MHNEKSRTRPIAWQSQTGNVLAGDNFNKLLLSIQASWILGMAKYNVYGEMFHFLG